MSFDKKIDALVKRHKKLSDLVSSPDKLKGDEFVQIFEGIFGPDTDHETALALRAATAELEDARR